MTDKSARPDDPLEDFEPRSFTFDRIEKRVWVSGVGPAVIVMTEMPGISPEVARFARWVREAGFTVYMPTLFGRDGAVPTPEEGGKVFQRACVGMEFRTMAGGGSSPVTDWLRQLAKTAHDECGGIGVGAIGMCFTGNFALSMMLEPSVRAPVLCQPSLPLDDPTALESPPEELSAVRDRLEQDGLDVLAYRFEGDQICRAARFAAYEQALGNRFKARILPDEGANEDVAPFFEKFVPYPHSVVTQHLINREGEPTIAARDEIIGFFRSRLTSAAATNGEHAG